MGKVFVNERLRSAAGVEADGFHAVGLVAVGNSEGRQPLSRPQIPMAAHTGFENALKFRVRAGACTL